MQLYFIEWRDAYDPEKTGWLTKEDVDKIISEDALIQSVGWLYHEDDTYITIVGDYQLDGDVSRPTRIPKGMVTQRIILTPILGRQ